MSALVYPQWFQCSSVMLRVSVEKKDEWLVVLCMFFCFHEGGFWFIAECWNGIIHRENETYREGTSLPWFMVNLHVHVMLDNLKDNPRKVAVCHRNFEVWEYRTKITKGKHPTVFTPNIFNGWQVWTAGRPAPLLTIEPCYCNIAEYSLALPCLNEQGLKKY